MNKPEILNIRDKPINKKNILIIEDNSISRKLLKVALENDSYNVFQAATGAEGLNLAKTLKLDLIIQDLVLPDIEGILLNQKLRALPNLKSIPIFAITGFLSQMDKYEGHQGFTTLLLKPIDPSFLLDVVKAYLPTALPTGVLKGEKKRVLIADDNPIQLKLLAMQLTNAGFEVISALDGQLALKEARNIHPDIIVSDVLMPNLDGFGLCLEIKKDEKLCTIPIILLSSHYLENEDLELAKKVGASSYLTRTPDEAKLVSELLRVLNTKMSTTSTTFELTEEIKEKHTIRSVRQLERQVSDNAKLAQRCASLMSQLTLINGIANALTVSGEDINSILKEVLYFCLDATGISKGALYIKKSDIFILNNQIGYQQNEIKLVESLFGLTNLIPQIIKKGEPLTIPSDLLDKLEVKTFLEKARVLSASIIPLFSGAECLGILFLGSDLNNLSGENSKEFVRTLGLQFGQSISLATTFEKLSTSENRYRQLVEISPDAIFIHQDEKLVYANSAALTLLGSNNLNELINYSFMDFFPPDFRKTIEESIKSSTTLAHVPLFDGKITNLKGELLDVEIVISPFIYQEKSAVYMIMRDITDRKRSALHLEIQYAIAWTLAESATLAMATSKILKIICEQLEWDCGAIWAVDKEANVLRCTRVWQKPEILTEEFSRESQNVTWKSGEGLLGKVWKDKKPIWKANILKEDDFFRKNSVANVGLHTTTAFPIIYEKEVLGVFEFFNKKIIQSDPPLLLWFESIGNQFGLFLIRKHMEKQMLYLAEHDVLTGLSNRSLLEQYLNTALNNARDNNEKLAILFLDLDHFKYVNDSMGHQAGDLLLKEIAERFRQSLRPQDTISRLGGDEFIIIIPTIHETEALVEIISRLQKQLSSQILLKEKEFFITASIGISLYPENGTTVQNLIRAADLAMYAAKAKGRNNFQFCTPEMTIQAENRSLLQKNLRLALDKNEFLVYYQPKIDVATQKISGMEALIRWKKDDIIIMPGIFISAAEESELIIPMGEWVLKTAYLQNKAWQDAGLPTLTVSVNLSIRNLNKQLLDLVEKVINETNLQPNSFEIELTESVLMENVESNIQILRSLKEMGLQISIDDFGTGYSSLSYLKRFPIDTLKIDQSFVRDIATDPDDAAIVSAIIAMAHSLGFKVIAEGVETKDQLKFLCQHGCDQIQGFYFSRPLPVDEATLFIQEGKTSWDFD